MVRLRERRTTRSQWRQRLITFVCLSVFGALLGGTTWRGSFQGARLISEADRRYVETVPLNGERGVVWDRNGRLLAASAVVYSAYINPTLYQRWALKQDQIELAQHEQLLQERLGIEPSRLREILARDSGFAYLVHDLMPGQRSRINSLKLPHLGMEKRYRRFYPAAQEAAHVVGFIDHAGVGQEGIERFSEQHLAPRSGQMRVLRTNGGEVLELFESVPATNGQDLAVTIDTRLQYFASVAMSRIVEYHDANSASIVMLDIRTGDILVMANVPTYNPNSGTNDPDQRRNRVVQDSFEPGSTVKPLLAAIAIEAGVVEPNTILQTAKPIYYRGKTITDKKIKTNIDLNETIMRSSNKGAVRVAEMLSNEVMWQGFAEFGIGSHLLGWPGENPGVLHDWQKWRPVEKATMAYGYFLASNLLQLARAYAALGNDGVLPTPGLIIGESRAPARRAISAETAAKVMAMMENVVSTHGTAPKANINGYRVAGKTGTSHKRRLNVKGYDTSVFRSLFVGLAPASDPVFVAAVLVDEPRRNGYYGGTVAAPIFSEVVGHALQLYGIAPDRLSADEQLIPTAEVLSAVALARQ